MATHSPIEWFLSLPWLQARDWYMTVAKIQADGD